MFVSDPASVEDRSKSVEDRKETMSIKIDDPKGYTYKIPVPVPVPASKGCLYF